MDSGTPLIEFRHLKVRRGSILALNGLDLTIPEGECVAILGPNGSGKSTLLKVITRECYPLLGEPSPVVRLFGRETWNVFQLREQMGIVTNDLVESCRRDFRVSEIVISGFFSSIGLQPYHRVNSEMEDRAHGAMKMLEIAHLARRWTDELSSGELQRVVIARALVHLPKALILDEPSNSLDIRAASELRDTLRGLACQGMSIIVVTHHLPDLIPEIRRVALMKDGRIWRDGRKTEVLNGQTLSELFGVPATLVEREGYFHLL